MDLNVKKAFVIKSFNLLNVLENGPNFQNKRHEYSCKSVV